MDELSFFPPINATLNATCGVLLALGYRAIKRGRVITHTRCMIAAIMVSIVFLACYVTYHTLKQRLTGQAHTVYTHTGVIRYIYYSILFSHLTLAIVIVPMVIITVHRGLKSRFEKHVRIARWTFPLWMYVSITGVIVYFMLYHF